MDSNVTAAIARGAPTLSDLVIAWQARLTRQSVRASKKAVTDSESAVAIAQRSLTEKQLARLESTVPHV